MPRRSEKKLNRVIDANFNRAKEGLRVCEDICRFVWDDPQLTRRYKSARHKLSEISRVFKTEELINAREIRKDVGRGSIPEEFKRAGAKDIYYANSQRAKESVRVLEEFGKLKNKPAAEAFKKLRYTLYALEKNIIKRR